MPWDPVLKKNLLKSVLTDPVKKVQNVLPKIILTITFWKNYKNNARDTNYFTKCLCGEWLLVNENMILIVSLNEN